MCGFSGIASPYYQDNRDWLLKSSNTLLHRGPDDEGIFWNDNYTVGLAHRRLSIIDLSDHGKQPMLSDNKKITLVFNGEIYNYLELKEMLVSKGYKFKSNCDTEVILKSYEEWGIEMPKKFIGMFSLALYDGLLEKLILIRDRAGEKPLFYNKNDNGIFFSSELQALFCNDSLPRKLDLYGLSGYLSMGHKPGDRTLVEGFNTLNPGNILEYNCKNNSYMIHKYWDIPKPISFNTVTEDYLLDKIEYLLEDSINKQMRSDVPIGFHLSGGIDSSLVTALASRSFKNLKTYSITFPEFSEINEEKYSSLIAKSFNTNHKNIELESSHFEILLKVLSNVDEPIGDSSLLACWFLSKKISDECKVSISGDGADELFAGYKHYRRLYYLHKINRITPKKFNSILKKIFYKHFSFGKRGKSIIDLLNTNLDQIIPSSSLFFENSQQEILCPILRNKFIEKNYLFKKDKNLDIIQNLTILDFKNYMLNDILVKIDMTSMLNSVELRSPFLDYRIMNFAFSEVPSFLKLKKNRPKYLLKKLASKILPEEFEIERKKGFIFPTNQFINHKSNFNFIKEVLMDNNLLFNKEFILKLFDDNKKGINNANYIFLLLQLNLWISRNNIKI